MDKTLTLPLSYSPNLQKYYERLIHLPGFVLLESTDRLRGRYDIISACPYDSIKIDQNTSDFSEVLKKINHTLSPQRSEISLPFQGGAIGYVSYDFGARLFGIHSTHQTTLNDMPLLDLGLYDWAIISDHQKKKVTLFAANTHQATKGIVEEVLHLWSNVEIKPYSAQLKNNFIPLITQEEYSNSFYEIYNYLKEGRTYQVNFTQPFHAAYEGDSWAIYKKISTKNPVPFGAFLRTTHADILSFSPEQFLLYEQGVLRTSPIKGTIGRSINPFLDNRLKHQLISCEKNRAENIMIVDLLRNDLGKIAIRNSVVVTSLCEVQSYHEVHHLVSSIEAQCLPDILPFHSFLSCFPGGSITGAPKMESMKIIKEQELYSRGVYCGSIGYFSRHGYFNTSIAIRTITAKNDILHLAAGGGIVIDSKCEDEYRECFIKIAAIINGLK